MATILQLMKILLFIIFSFLVLLISAGNHFLTIITIIFIVAYIDEQTKHKNRKRTTKQKPLYKSKKIKRPGQSAITLAALNLHYKKESYKLTFYYFLMI